MNRARREQAELERWVREHGPSVLGYLLARVRDRHLADDLLQETFFRAWRARGRYAAAGRERAYLIRIADRLALDQLRRGVRQRAAELDEAGPEADESEAPLARLLAGEAQHQLADALAALSEPQRRTLLLRYYGQMSFQDIARTLACPLGTALSHCRRGLSALRKLLVEQSE